MLTYFIDPAVKAMADKSLRGKIYGTKTNPVKSFSTRGQGLINHLGAMHMGGAY
jgi:hypothetical protein